MATTGEYFVSGISILIGAGLFWYGFNRMHEYRLIQDTPRSKIRSMAMGIVEVEGKVLADKTILAPFSQTKCVYYEYKIEEYVKHTSRDAKGNVTTSYSWDMISSGEQRIPFFAKDETGQAYVDPKGAEFNVPVKKMFLQRGGAFGAVNTIVSALKNWDNNKNNTQSKLNVSSWGLTPLDLQTSISFGYNVGDRRYYETYIEPDEALYVLGTAANDSKSPNNVLIKKGENEKTFVISDKSEKELLGSLKWQMIAFFVIGGAIIIFGIFLLLKLLGVS